MIASPALPERFTVATWFVDRNVAQTATGKIQRFKLRRGVPPGFGLELPLVEDSEGREGRGVGGRLVVAEADDPGEAEGQARGVLGAPLDLVVGDLHHHLRPHGDRVAVVGRGQGR